jgi:hypothetical protein
MRASTSGGSPTPVKNVIAGLMLLEAATLAIASIVHFGIVIRLGFMTLDDPFPGARIPEAVVAFVIALGALSLLTRWAAASWLPLAATIFGIIGVLVGIRFTLMGVGSRPGDLIYHGLLLAALLVTLALLLLTRAVAADRS